MKDKKSKDNKFSRRDFLRNTSLAAAGAAAGLTAGGCESTAGLSNTAIRDADTSKILNYNPNMHYRRLGKTGLMVSEISFGGHSRNEKGGSMWFSLANEVVPPDIARNRIETMSRAIELGMNYLDITTAAECQLFGVALKGRREKMYVAADDSELCMRKREYCNVESQMLNIDEALRYLLTDYLDIWRPQFEMDGTSTDADIEVCIETFEKAKKQGKVRWLGTSSHNRDFLIHLIKKYPQYSMVIFPYTAKSKVKPADVGSVDPKNVSEVGKATRNSGSVTGGESIFQTVKKHDIGVITIKPFSGGSLFRSRFGVKSLPFYVEPEKNELTAQVDEIARLTLAYILCNDGISATIPGLSTPREVENAVRASAERHALMEPENMRKFCEAADAMLADLDPDYQWLSDWEWV